MYHVQPLKFVYVNIYMKMKNKLSIYRGIYLIQCIILCMYFPYYSHTSYQYIVTHNDTYSTIKKTSPCPQGVYVTLNITHGSLVTSNTGIMCPPYIHVQTPLPNFPHICTPLNTLLSYGIFVLQTQSILFRCIE